MIEFNYNPKITGRVLKTREEQYDKFFNGGHPRFLIPDFSSYPEDIWLAYLDFLANAYECEMFDQDGGEVHSIEILDINTGLTKCIYTAYGVILDERDEPQDVDVEIEGYVVEMAPLTEFNESKHTVYVFVATMVFESYKMSI